MVTKGKGKAAKCGFAVLIVFVFCLGAAHLSFSGEYTARAVAYGFNPDFNLQVVYVQHPGRGDEYVVSGFAPGVGSFYQNVSPDAVRMKYSAGKAEVKARVTTSMGTVVDLRVKWDAPAGVGVKDRSVAGGNPPQTVFIAAKPSKVSGKIGAFTIATAYAEIDQRRVTP